MSCKQNIGGKDKHIQLLIIYLSHAANYRQLVATSEFMMKQLFISNVWSTESNLAIQVCTLCYKCEVEQEQLKNVAPLCMDTLEICLFGLILPFHNTVSCKLECKGAEKTEGTMTSFETLKLRQKG